MKKLITAFMAFILSAACFAETGYRNLQWYEHISDVHKKNSKLQKSFTEREIMNQLEYMKEISNGQYSVKKNIINQQKDLFLFFNNTNSLQNIGYIIESSETENLIKNYKTKIKEYAKVCTFEESKEEDRISIIGFIWVTNEYEIGNYKLLHELTEEKGNGFIHIYDYNDDTRVYIYENIIKDKTIVVYVPHEQDY